MSSAPESEQQHAPDEGETTDRLEELHDLVRGLAEDANPETVLRRVAGAVRRAVDATAVNIERYPSIEGASVAVVTAGPRVGSPDDLNRALRDAQRTVISLGRRNERLGKIVIWRRRGAARVTELAVERLATLAHVAALALRHNRLDEDLSRLQTEHLTTLDNKYRLITGISEELKSRLGVAAEYVQLLDTERELTERESRFIQRGRQSIDSAVHLINELVQLSRAETGRLELNPEPVSPSVLLRSIVRDYQLEIGTIGVEFELRMQDTLPVIVTDIDAVRQVLDNLLSNAVRYTPAGGRITVVADVRPGRRRSDPSKYVCFSVTDTGPGIGDQNLIFEAVYRVERRGATPGFRLAISRRIAHLLEGELTLDASTADGSTFTLWLPGTTTAKPPPREPDGRPEDLLAEYAEDTDPD